MASVVVGLVVGAVSALVLLGNGQLLGRQQHAGGWFGNANAGSTAADPYTRAIIARIGLMALNRSETIYFHNYTDDRGDRLSQDCVYELSGGDLPARWWGVTIYAGDDFLPVNGDDAQSVDKTRMVRDADGRWTARVAATRADASNWISSKNAGTFSLGIRMYNPDPGARDDPATIPFPVLKRLSCAGDQA
ncbi:DUF1214 domain-containing protein [Brevundimonas aurifodinae]|uniref:DUF1214 domain-containing protein n=1 Tax=Brevundimonas aurifodinae TaxID=1508312 RepID=A0ABV1NML0_9CAUL